MKHSLTKSEFLLALLLGFMMGAGLMYLFGMVYNVSCIIQGGILDPIIRGGSL